MASIIIETDIVTFLSELGRAEARDQRVREACSPGAELALDIGKALWQTPATSIGTEVNPKARLAEFYRTRCRILLAKDGNVVTGGVVVLDGVVRSLWANKGVGAWLLLQAEAHGGKRLDCLAGPLCQWYKDHGWKVERVENNYDAGLPDVVFMFKK